MTFDECLNEIYARYLRVAPKIKDKLDREARSPQILLELSRKLDLIPPLDKVIKITGSKGKGTTTRLISNLIMKNRPKARVGLLISPESVEHNDRIRINNTPVSMDRFVELYLSLQKELNLTLSNNAKQNAYLSPSGIFMLMALLYFKQEKVDFYVLETGRGALHDEVGNIPAQLSVITSIFAEHLDKLGPTLSDIAIEKLGISNFSRQVLLSQELSSYLPLQTNTNFSLVEITKPVQHNIQWLSHNYNLAKEAVKIFLSDEEIRDLSEIQSPSFFEFKLDHYHCIADAGIALDCLDHNLLSKLEAPLFLCSLPDDKSPLEITSYLKKFSPFVLHIPLLASKSSLKYDQTLQHFQNEIIEKVDPYGHIDLNLLIRRIEQFKQVKTLYFIGTQSYLRLIKKALYKADCVHLNFL